MRPGARRPQERPDVQARRSMLSTSVTPTAGAAFRLLMRLLVVGLALLVVGCGNPGQGASPSPSENPLHFDVTATEKDHALSMHVGQKLELVLHGGELLRYQQVTSSNTSILEPTVD